MPGRGYVKFRNDCGVREICTGVKEFKCIGESVGPAGGAAVRAPAGGTAYRAPAGGAYYGGSARPYYPGAAVATGVVVGAAASAAYRPPPYYAPPVVVAPPPCGYSQNQLASDGARRA